MCWISGMNCTAECNIQDSFNTVIALTCYVVIPLMKNINSLNFLTQELTCEDVVCLQVFKRKE